MGALACCFLSFVIIAGFGSAYQTPVGQTFRIQSDGENMNALFNFLTFHTPLFYLIQSVWRDEAFSYFMAKPNLLKIIATTAQDFNPPLYYLLLHLWMYMAGHSDIGLRLLSFIFLFYLLNPMLLYYAFEMRMYSLYAMFTTLALFYLISKNWKAYTVSAVLGLYSHTFFLLLPLSFAVYAYILKKARQEISLILRPLLFFIPWLPIVISQFIRSKESWLFPVDWQLINSVLGNLFTGYEGTPWFLWKYTFYFSMFIIFCSFLSLRKKIINIEK